MKEKGWACTLSRLCWAETAAAGSAEELCLPVLLCLESLIMHVLNRDPLFFSSVHTSNAPARVFLLAARLH